MARTKPTKPTAKFRTKPALAASASPSPTREAPADRAGRHSRRAREAGKPGVRAPSSGATAAQAPGGRSLGLAGRGAAELVRAVRSGLPFGTLHAFQRSSGMSVDEISRFTRIPKRTISRRQSSGRFDTDESDRLLRLSALFDRALDLFDGDVDRTRRWLDSPKRALGDATPLEYAATEVGAREVEALIARLEHGVFS